MGNIDIAACVDGCVIITDPPAINERKTVKYMDCPNVILLTVPSLSAGRSPRFHVTITTAAARRKKQTTIATERRTISTIPTADAAFAMFFFDKKYLFFPCGKYYCDCNKRSDWDCAKSENQSSDCHDFCPCGKTCPVVDCDDNGPYEDNHGYDHYYDKNGHVHAKDDRMVAPALCWLAAEVSVD